MTQGDASRWNLRGAEQFARGHIYTLGLLPAIVRSIVASGANVVYDRDVVSNSKGKFVGEFAVAFESNEGEIATKYRAF